MLRLNARNPEKLEKGGAAVAEVTGNRLLKGRTLERIVREIWAARPNKKMYDIQTRKMPRQRFPATRTTAGQNQGRSQPPILFGSYEVGRCPGICSWNSIKNQQIKESKSDFPESQRACAVLACGRAREAEG
ncbi:hypothetical protein AgCh_031624 [Apium graveolens]